MPGVAVLRDAGGIADVDGVGDAAFPEKLAMPPASPTTATPDMVLTNLTIFRDGQSF